MAQLSVAIRSYNSYMCEIPEHFPVLNEYLHGLTEDRFCRAFGQLEKIIVRIYDDILEHPETVGLTVKDKKTGEWKVQTSQHISCVKKILYTIGRFGTLDHDTLCIPMPTLMNAYMTYFYNISVELAETVKQFDREKQEKFYLAKHLPAVFACLTKFGFTVDETEASDTTVELRYPADPSVISVLKAFSEPRICRVSFGFDFTKCNYRVFAYPADAILPLEALYSYVLLSEENKRFLAQLNAQLEELGATYGECAGGWYSGTLPCDYNYKNKVRILQNIEHGLIPHVVLRFGKKAERMGKFIESLPEEYRGLVQKCQGCRKGECDHRIPVVAGQQKFMICNVAWWYFPADIKAIPYIVAAYRI